jgi:uncharacterized protein
LQKVFVDILELSMNGKRLRIPNEDVKLDADEIAVTQTRTFQRLFHLNQLGLAYLVYPAATHTRGVHSIKCVQEADKILEALGKKEFEKDKKDVLDVRMAALIHDIGHIPFSHTLEDEHKILEKHDGSERLDSVISALKEELGTNNVAIQRVLDAVPILTATKENRNWKSDVVSNTICADLLAYIATDAEFTGIDKRPGHYRIYEYFYIHDDQLCIKLTKGGTVRRDIISAITDLLDMRYALTERVIYHHAKCTASAMLARAARLCGLTESPELTKMGDEVFLEHLESLANKKSSNVNSSSEAKGALKLLSNLRSRRLYQRVYLIGYEQREAWDRNHRGAWDRQNHGPISLFCQKWRDNSTVEDLLRQVENQCKLPLGSLALWCPEAKASMKLARVKITWESMNNGKDYETPCELRSEDIKDLDPNIFAKIRLIESQYLHLWNFWIVLDRSYIDQAAHVVKTLSRKLELDCDYHFRARYLEQITDFVERNKTLDRIDDCFEHYEAELVDPLMAGVSHRDGPDVPGSDDDIHLLIQKTAQKKAKNESNNQKVSSKARAQRETDKQQLDLPVANLDSQI